MIRGSEYSKASAKYVHGTPSEIYCHIAVKRSDSGRLFTCDEELTATASTG
jgi:hypothetical protein